MLLYFEATIQKECAKAVDKRIISDTTKLRNWDLDEKMKLFEQSLLLEARRANIDVDRVR